MSETDGKKPLGLGGSRPGQVKQSFSHGRTKAVIVETKKKRVVVPTKPGHRPLAPVEARLLTVILRNALRASRTPRWNAA